MSRDLHDAPFGEARLREHRMLQLLASVAAGQHEPDGRKEGGFLRQLGYACQLAEGRVEDPNDNPGRVSLFCRESLGRTPGPPGPFRDPVQTRWGAEWHLDVGKVRSELPVYLMALQRGLGQPRAGRSSGRLPGEPARERPAP